MKVDKIELGAIIPTVQYGNLQPKIILTDVDAQEGLDYAMSYIKPLWAKYSEKGELTAKEVSSAIIKKSFNEGIDISYDDDSHTYHYEGERLVSATGYTSKFYKPFQADFVAKACSGKWGVEEDDIKEMWKSNGDLASGLGKVVHKALEHWIKFKAQGETIATAKGDDVNYALPKHPILRKIITEFESQEHGHDEAVKLVPEALITCVEKKLCGHSDLVLIKDLENKICRIQDYKINIDSELVDSKDKAGAPFNELPANKVTKYQIQLSIYANMMELSGWTVEGLDVFVYEDEWKHHKLEVLNVVK